MSDPTITVRILKSFLEARQAQVEQVCEKTVEPLINVTTYHQHDADGNLLVEDVVVEPRVYLFPPRG